MPKLSSKSRKACITFVVLPCQNYESHDQSNIFFRSRPSHPNSDPS
jgi:hypothetical protein